MDKSEAIGKNIIDLLAPQESLNIVSENFDNLNRDGHWEGDFDVKRKDQSTIPVHITNTYLKDIEGNNTGFIGVSFNIKERQDSEIELRKSNQLLEASQKISHVGGWEIDVATNELFWTNETYRIYDTSPEEFNPTVDAGVGYFLPESRRIISEAIDKAINHGIGYDLELETLTTKGRHIYVRKTCKATILDGNTIKLTGTFQDITDKQKAEKNLKEREQKFRQLFENMSHGVIYQSADGIINDTNDAALKMFGLTREQLLGRKFFHDDWHLIDENGRKLLPEEHPSMVSLRTGKTIINYMLGVYRQETQNYVWIIINAIPEFKEGEQKPFQVFVTMHDITQRKLAEIKLTESLKREQFLADIVRESSVGIAVGYPDGRLGMCNSAYQKITGYSESELQNIDWNSVLTPQKWEELEHEKLQEVHTTKKSVQYEKEYIKKDGTIVPIELLVHPHLGSDGEVECYLGFVLNITKRIKVEKEKDKLFYDLGERMKELSCLYNISKVIEQPGITLEKIFEESVNLLPPSWQFPETTCAKLIYKNTEYKTANFKETKWKQSVELNVQGEYLGELTVCYLEEMPKSDSGTFLKEEENLLKAVAERLETVIERKHYQTELLKSKEESEENEEKYRLLHENAGLGISYYSPDGIVISYNSIAAKNMNGTPESFSEKSIFELFPKDEADFYYDRIQKALNTSEITEYEDLVSLPNAKKWFLSTYAIITNSKKEVLGIQIISQDITDMKNSEIELKIAKEKAEETDRLKSAFLANMSHEIRTPLNAIIGFSTLIASNSEKKEHKDLGLVIKKQSDLLVNTIDDMLDFSMIESGSFEIEAEPMDMNLITAEVYKVIKPLVSDSVNLILDMPKEVASIISDENRFKQIFINLLVNAVKFTKFGEIRFGYKIDDEHISCFVSDTGIGIAKENQEKIFEQFTKLDSFSQGTGLGLSIVKKIITLMGGELSVESELNKGTLFSFRIPIVRDNKTNDQVNTISEQTPKEIQDMTILIAEDQFSNSKFLELVLAEHFSRVLLVTNGLDAIEIIKENEDISLILMDIKMPIMDGIEATKKIKLIKPDVIIIAQTAYAQNSDRELALEAGCDDYIAKPIDAEKLIEMIKKH